MKLRKNVIIMLYFIVNAVISYSSVDFSENDIDMLIGLDYSGYKILEDSSVLNNSTLITLEPFNKTLKVNLLEYLSKGSMGRDIYAADLSVAGKSYKDCVIKSDDISRSGELLNEYYIMSSIGNSDILPKPIAVFKSRNKVYYAMEKAGNDLNKLISRHELSKKEFKSIALQLINAVDHIHKKGIIHNDLKPSNIGISQDSNGVYSVKLLDFGLSGFQGSEISTIPQTIFVAPELLKLPKYSSISDTYSVAQILFYMITGEYFIPFILDDYTFNYINLFNLNDEYFFSYHSYLESKKHEKLLKAVVKSCHYDPEKRKPLKALKKAIKMMKI